MNYVGWLVVFVIFAALELVSLGLTCIWFAIGALSGCVTSLFTDNWIIQALVFIVVTVAVLIILRPIAVKYINGKAEKTNVESMTNKVGKVIVDIDNINATGMVVIDGMEWTARSKDGDIIPKDTLVEVVSIEGVKAIVKKKQQ
jgi:membrane protein implicated in regulation of membrane protease activity